MNRVLQVGVAIAASLASFFSSYFGAEKAALVNQPLPIQTRPAVVRHIARPVVQVPVAAPVQHKVAPAPQAVTPSVSRKPIYRCRFSGQALLAGQPVANAAISIWVTSPRIEETRTVYTDEQGRFSASFVLDGLHNEPVDWQIKGRTDQLMSFEAAGRKIFLEGEHEVSIDQAVTFEAE